jgi:hypothetical protein
MAISKNYPGIRLQRLRKTKRNLNLYIWCQKFELGTSRIQATRVTASANFFIYHGVSNGCGCMKMVLYSNEVDKIVFIISGSGEIVDLCKSLK